MKALFPVIIVSLQVKAGLDQKMDHSSSQSETKTRLSKKCIRDESLKNSITSTTTLPHTIQ